MTHHRVKFHLHPSICFVTSPASKAFRAAFAAKTVRIVKLVAAIVAKGRSKSLARCNRRRIHRSFPRLRLRLRLAVRTKRISLIMSHVRSAGRAIHIPVRIPRTKSQRMIGITEGSLAGRANLLICQPAMPLGSLISHTLSLLCTLKLIAYSKYTTNPTPPSSTAGNLLNFLWGNNKSKYH